MLDYTRLCYAEQTQHADWSEVGGYEEVRAKLERLIVWPQVRSIMHVGRRHKAEMKHESIKSMKVRSTLSQVHAEALTLYLYSYLILIIILILIPYIYTLYSQVHAEALYTLHFIFILDTLHSLAGACRGSSSSRRLAANGWITLYSYLILIPYTHTLYSYIIIL